MNKLACAFLAVLIASLAGLAVAGEGDAPQNQGETTQSSTPLQAWETLWGTLRGGQSDQIAPLFHVSTERDKAFVEDLKQITAAIAELRQAAETKWGKGHADEFVGERPDEMYKWNVIVDGTHANLQQPHAQRPVLKMVQIEGRWQLDFDGSLALYKEDSMKPAKALATFSALAKEIHNFAAELKDTTYSMPIVCQNFDMRTRAILMGTQPATQP